MKPSNTALAKAVVQLQSVVATELREVRINAELSQSELAERACIDRKTVNRIENGHFSPNLDTLARLATALNVRPTDLLIPSGRRK